MYEYFAKVTKIVDADTVDLEVDLGFKTIVRQRFRLYGIDAYEVRGAEREMGLKAKAWVQSIMPIGTPVRVETYKTDKYGRYLADIFLDGEEKSLSEELLDRGFAVLYLP